LLSSHRVLISVKPTLGSWIPPVGRVGSSHGYGRSPQVRGYCFRDTAWLVVVPRPCTYAVTAAGSGAALTRSARPKARRRRACSRQSPSGCSQAPRPGRRRRRSGVSRTAPVSSVSATTRRSADQLSVLRHPTHVRVGCPCGVWRVVLDAPGRSPVRSVATSLAPTAARQCHPHLRATSRRVRCPGGCRSASRSAWRRGGRSGPPCRWPATAGSPGRRPEPNAVSGR
jgi:hypothetical protein